MTRALVERAMDAEMTHHLGYERHDPAGHHSGNSRNGTYPKTVTGEHGEMTVAVPRDRASSFEPQIIKKGQRRFDGFDGKVLSMYARGMTVRDIQGHLQELYGARVSPDLISSVTDAVADEVKAWQAGNPKRAARLGTPCASARSRLPDPVPRRAASKRTPPQAVGH